MRTLNERVAVVTGAASGIGRALALALAQRGAILALALFGLLGMPENSAYCASKFAVRGLSESLGVELAGSNVGVTCVHPGGVRTDIARRARLRDERRRAVMTAEFDRIARMTPEGAAARIVTAIERGTPRLRLGPETYLFDWAKRLAPVATQRLLVGAYRRVKARLAVAEPGVAG